LLLQPPDLMADRRLRHVQLRRRPRETHVAGGSLERAQTIQGGEHNRILA
jgi:hypothetical protein